MFSKQTQGIPEHGVAECAAGGIGITIRRHATRTVAPGYDAGEHINPLEHRPKSPARRGLGSGRDTRPSHYWGSRNPLHGPIAPPPFGISSHPAAPPSRPAKTCSAIP
ncbi:MAG TPA: hypothetical protein VHB01_11065 [Nitrosospira sp.]|nr:hypothetical protein [Nitrosospira sp.]